MTIRSKDLETIYSCIEAGESAQILGMSGVGKSNHFNNVLDPQNIEAHFKNSKQKPILVRVNFHYAVDFSPRTVYSLMLEPLESPDYWGGDVGIAKQVEEFHNRLLDVGDDILKAQRLFRQALRLVMQPEGQKLYFVFDQFDKMLREAPSRLFANLRGLREEFKYRLGFIIFARQPLDQLVPDAEEAQADYEEFLELFQSRKIGLAPYNEPDSVSNIERILKRNSFDLDAAAYPEIITLSGGHGGLNKALVNAVCQDGYVISDDFGKHVHVQTECQKIWASLDSYEQACLKILFRGKSSKVEEELKVQKAEGLLRMKGCLDQDNQLFSSIFQSFIETNREYEHALEYDPATRMVSVFGMEQEPLTNREVEIFEYLFEHAGEVVSADEVARTVWGDSDPSTISTLRQNISRLRKKVQIPGNPSRFVDNASAGTGYILRID